MEILKDDPEVKKVQVFSTSIISTESLLHRLEYFGDWNKAKRDIANCLHYKRILMNRIYKDSKGIDIDKTSNNVDDLQKAKVSISRIVQKFILKRNPTSSVERLQLVLSNHCIV